MQSICKRKAFTDGTKYICHDGDINLTDLVFNDINLPFVERNDANHKAKNLFRKLWDVNNMLYYLRNKLCGKFLSIAKNKEVSIYFAMLYRY